MRNAPPSLSYRFSPRAALAALGIESAKFWGELHRVGGICRDDIHAETKGLS